jgi:hypothetical protein
VKRRVLAVLLLALAGTLLAGSSSVENVETVGVIEPVPPLPGDGGQ